MKRISQILVLTVSCCLITSCQKSGDAKQEEGSTAIHKEGEKPIQHLQLPDITSHKKAIQVMKSTTDLLKTKTKLDGVELGEIHIITYSLEKAIAFFVDNTKGDQQAAAKKMAELVEEVHLNSENNRAQETKAALDQYFKLEQMFSKNL